jgi:hypothetical protein
MIFYWLALQMPLHNLQIKSEIHYKQKWIIKISPKLQTSWKKKQKKKTKRTWNERHGKHNWNKDGFRVYLACHLKEVGILPNPRLNFLQIV